MLESWVEYYKVRKYNLANFVEFRYFQVDQELNSASRKYPLGILLMDPTTPKTRNTWKNVMMMSSYIIITFFQVFLVFGVAGSVKSMQCGYSLDAESTSSPDWNLSKNTRRYVENTNTKNSFFLSSSKINQYYFIILTIILLF